MAEEKKNAATAKNTSAVKKEDNKKLSFFQRVGKWFRDMKSELKKVVWPTKKELVKNTGIALAVMAVSAVVLWLFDKGAGAAVNAILQVFGKG